MHRRQNSYFFLSGIIIVLLVSFLCQPTVSSGAQKHPVEDKLRFLLPVSGQTGFAIEGLLSKKEKKEWQNIEDLSPEERQALEKKYKEWESLSPEEKRKIRQRLNRWKKMSPQERELYQKRYEQWQNLSPEERKKLQEELERWEDLTPREKEAIRHQFKKNKE